MIINCPHCGKQIRVADEGMYRCPLCLSIFELHSEQPAIPPAPVETEPATPAETVIVAAPEPEIADAEPTPVQADSPTVETGLPVNEIAASPLAPLAPTEPAAPAAEAALGDADLCETCRRKPATLICHETGLLICDDCAAYDAQGRPLWQGRRATATPLEQSALDMMAGLIRRPDATFAQLQPNYRHLRSALLVALYGGLVQIVATTLYGLVIPWPWDDLVFSLAAGRPVAAAVDPSSFCCALPFSVVLLPISLFFSALVFHFFHRLIGSGRGGLAASFKVTLYAELPMLFYLLPVAGPFLAAAGSIALATIGGARVHQVSRRRALLAVLLLWATALLLIASVSQMGTGELMYQPSERV